MRGMWVVAAAALMALAAPIGEASAAKGGGFGGGRGFGGGGFGGGGFAAKSFGGSSVKQFGGGGGFKAYGGPKSFSAGKVYGGPKSFGGGKVYAAPKVYPGAKAFAGPGYTGKLPYKGAVAGYGKGKHAGHPGKHPGKHPHKHKKYYAYYPYAYWAAPLAIYGGAYAYDYYYGDCDYEYRQWQITGSPYWRDRYYECIGY